MGRDKSMLEFHGVPHWQYLRDVLLTFFDEVYLSCRPDQATVFPNEKLILDQSQNMVVRCRLEGCHLIAQLLKQCH